MHESCMEHQDRIVMGLYAADIDGCSSYSMGKLWR